MVIYLAMEAMVTTEAMSRIDPSLEGTNLLKRPQETKGTEGNQGSVNRVEGPPRDPISTSEVSRGFPKGTTIA